MTTIRLALAALSLSALPAMAGSLVFDLPRLDFGTPAPVTQGCASPATPGPAMGCRTGK
ncbi:MAG: hypothetical protein ACK4GO_01020 [Gemmobacter sp.]